MTAWHVWTARSDDAGALALLEKRAFGAKSWGEDSVKASFVASGVSILLGGKAREAEGFALWRDLGEEAELLTIGVAPEARAAGLGGALLNAVLDAARLGGAHKVYLEVDDQNAQAMTMYQRHGFAKVGARVRYYRDGRDAAVMALDL